MDHQTTLPLTLHETQSSRLLRILGRAGGHLEREAKWFDEHEYARLTALHNAEHANEGPDSPDRLTTWSTNDQFFPVGPSGALGG